MSPTEDFDVDTVELRKDEYCRKEGKLMASPPPGEEIVISGMAGVFSNSRDICELSRNLFDKVDLVRPNDRWRCDHLEVPPKWGTVPEIDRYDGGFFGVHERQSDSLDPMARIFQEKVMEAVFDAGLHPSELEGSRTGVYVGVTSSENDRAWFLDDLRPQTFAVTGSERSMMAHRVSYFLKLKGPSVTLDTGCSSACHALENAYRAIRLGEIDNAIVGGTHLCLHPVTSIQFLRLGALGKSGSCNAFDVAADGYARGEGIVAVILQKARHSKRVYSRIVHAKVNSDGFKEQGIIFPSKDSQFKLLKDLYEDCGVDRFSLSFVEAHGTGTKVGDVQECGSLDNFFARGRRTPLPIGSIKSNIGHTEPASCLCSLVKCILAMETGFIPPNIHFKTPNDAIAGLMEGRLKVVVDKTPLEGENALIGINSFGLGGTNGHVLLRRNPKRKADFGDGLPRLACVSGRTEEAVDVLLDQVAANATDVEYVKLLHEVFARGIENHLYRGFTVASRCGAITKSCAFCPKGDKSLYVVFGELENWREVSRQLAALPAFRDFILRIQEHLTGKGVNILDALLNDGSLDGNRVPLLGAVAVQMAVVRLFELADVKPEGCFGYSLGALASAYHGKLLTLEETVRCAFAVNEAVSNDDGLKKASISKDNWVTCKTFRERYGNILKGEVLGKIEASTENLSHRMRDIPANSVLLEIGKALSKEAGEVPVISLFGDANEDHLVEFFAGLGRLYLTGCSPQIGRLYPPVDLPVGRGTPMISPYVRWNHSREKFVPQYHLDLARHMKRGVRHYKIELGDRRWAFIAGHSVDGKNLFPAAGYLYMAWETFCATRGLPLEASRVSFRNCRFVRATIVPSEGGAVFTVSVATGTGDFEIVEGSSVVTTGTVGLLPDHEVNVRGFGCSGSNESLGSWMEKGDVYKELRLRGYQYRDEFRGVERYDPVTSTAYLKWTQNWTALLDNMLQLIVFHIDDRLVHLPVSVARVDVAADVHLDLIREAFGDTGAANAPHLSVLNDRNTKRITCGGVTVSGVTVSPMARKRDPGTPLLESYEFVPNVAELDLHASVAVNVKVILENASARQFKAVELVDGDVGPLAPIVKSHLLRNEPSGQPAVKILSSRRLDVDVDVEDGKLEDETDCLVVIASRIINRPEILESAFSALKENGFIISRESPPCEVSSDPHPDLTIVTAHRTPSETILLLRRRSQRRETRYIEVNSSEDFSWLPEVQNALNEDPREDLVLYSRDPASGLVGLMRCLRKEYACGSVRCVFLMDEGGEFDPDSKIYRGQLEKNLAFNVFKDGRWGTFQHLPLGGSGAAEGEHCFVGMASRGDLSSLRWMGGALAHLTEPEPGKELIHVYCAALNFKDVVIATGKMTVIEDRLQQAAPFGLEFSGRDRRGKRVMGWCMQGALANLCSVDRDLVYGVPDEWTMEEAATVPFVYTTAISALIVCGRMRRGESVLIHSGAGGVGQAAINLALHYGCEVFTTVGSRDKRDFLKKTYPRLKDENIGSSHDESFEQTVLDGTNGRGVDVVLNSLAGEKLVASARCLAVGGRFLEIGKSDLKNNVHLRLSLFEKQASYHGVMLDKVYEGAERREARRTFEKLMGEGAVKPLNRTVFGRGEVERAFRFMATGRHVGKVLVEVREPERGSVVSPPVQVLCGLARYHCDPRMMYVIVGGLGGIGLELADWLVLRGARKLVLSSRKGVSTGYQRYRIRLWQSYGVVVEISTAPLSRREGCERLIEEGLRLGRVAAVFNLAVVLDDAVFENQTPESFGKAFEPKAVVTRHLDDVTRSRCPDLRDFVVFSSSVCGRGYIGQANYAAANSVAEGICRRRKREGYPALAVQWGPVGEVGIAVETLGDRPDVEMDGAVQQPISSCLRVLDALLAQREAVVVSSMVVGRKQEAHVAENVVEAVLRILGMKDSKYVSVHSTLAELGMDSMLAIEIKVALERDFEVFLSSKEMRTVTLARLKEIQEEKTGVKADANTKSESNLATEKIFRLSAEDLGDNTSRVVPELDEKSTPPKAVLFPGLEGFARVLKGLSEKLAEVRTVQYVPDGQSASVAKIVESLVPTVLKLLPEGKTFFFVAYSYGALVALEMVHVLESRGYSGTLICVDGGPLLSKGLANSLNAESERRLLTSLICQLLSLFVPQDEIIQNKANIAKCKTWRESINFATELAKNYDANKAYYVEKIAEAIYLRQQETHTYQPTYGDLKSDVKLFKPTFSVMQDVEEDYGLSRFFRKPVEIRYFEGNHETVLENEKLAAVINLCIQKLA